MIDFRQSRASLALKCYRSNKLLGCFPLQAEEEGAKMAEAMTLRKLKQKHKVEEKVGSFDI